VYAFVCKRNIKNTNREHGTEHTKSVCIKNAKAMKKLVELVAYLSFTAELETMQSQRERGKGKG